METGVEFSVQQSPPPLWYVTDLSGDFWTVTGHVHFHKGQVVAMLRILGYPAPDTDLQQV